MLRLALLLVAAGTVCLTWQVHTGSQPLLWVALTLAAAGAVAALCAAWGPRSHLGP